MIIATAGAGAEPGQSILMRIETRYQKKPPRRARRGVSP